MSSSTLGPGRSHVSPSHRDGGGPGRRRKDGVSDPNVFLPTVDDVSELSGTVVCTIPTTPTRPDPRLCFSVAPTSSQLS